MRQPYYWSARKRWYINLPNGKRVNLGPDKEKAFKKYHRLMGANQDDEGGLDATEVVLQFLEWCDRHRATRTCELYRFFLNSFIDHIQGIKCDDVKGLHVTRWTEKQGFRGNTANAAIRTAMRLFNWAAKEGLISKNPIRHVERPAAEPRDVYVSPDQFEELLSHIATDDPFRDLVEILKHTGCRPQEARAVEARHFNRQGRVWEFPARESKGRRDRIVVLDSRAYEITVRAVLRHPDGKIFRNRDGNAWTKDAINCRFRRLREKVEFQVFAYALRHSFITDALKNGVEPMTVATLAGHSSIEMVWKVYQKLRMQTDHMREAAEQATRRNHPGRNK